MGDVIRLLPEYLANQIAAGEVVQRPASVVKELLENAVDAKSTEVQLIVKEAGKQLVMVVDNGEGMSETDARMSFERHATSKIRTTEDLFCIRTMGFRGEALASIGAVAQVELKTKNRASETGTCLVVEGSSVVAQQPAAVPDGTAVAVKNLFFNVPARRNFLKSNAVEMRHIVEEFQRVALANPQITFSLYQNDLEMLHLPAGKLSQRIVSIFGHSYREQMAICEETTPFLTVKGYIGKPEFAKKSRGEQFFFVNNRFIRSAYLNHAVLTAYEGLLPKDSFPFYVLFIDINPAHIDINVHPTKTEVKFEDEKTVYAIVRAAVKQSLGLHSITPSLDFEGDVNFAPFQPVALPTESFELARSFEGFGRGEHRPAARGDWQQLYEPLRQASKPDDPDIAGLAGFDLLDDLAQKSPRAELGSSKTLQIHQRYVLVQVKSGLLLIHQQAAQERILYETYSVSLQRKTGSSQQLLFPQTISFSPADFALVMELSEEFRALGFQFSEFGKNTVVINGIPTDVPARDEKELVEGLLEQYKNNLTSMKLDKRESLARAMARRVSSRLTNRMTEQEMNALVDKLFACQVPNYTPGGQKTLVMVQLSQLQAMFN
jgi:DNA mismatch repair protein MutL